MPLLAISLLLWWDAEELPERPGTYLCAYEIAIPSPVTPGAPRFVRELYWTGDAWCFPAVSDEDGDYLEPVVYSDLAVRAYTQLPVWPL